MQAQIEDGEVLAVDGNACMRGYAYAQREVMNPTRTFTSTMKVTGGTEKLVSVKTEKEVPKDKVMECAEELRGKAARAPIAVGDLLIKNIAQTGIDLVATANVPKKE